MDDEDMRFPTGLILYTGDIRSVDGEMHQYKRNRPRTSIVEICLKPDFDESAAIIDSLVKDSLIPRF